MLIREVEEESSLENSKCLNDNTGVMFMEGGPIGACLGLFILSYRKVVVFQRVFSLSKGTDPSIFPSVNKRSYPAPHLPRPQLISPSKSLFSF